MSFLANTIGKLYDSPLKISLGIAGWIGIAWLILNRKRLKMHWIFAIIFSSIFVIYSVYAVQFFAIVESGFDWTKRAMSLYGMPFFIPVLLFLGALIFKRKQSEVFDIFTINTVLTCLGGRMNCFFAGCCKGSYLASLGFRVPTREIEVVFYLVFLILMVPKVYQKKTDGTAFPLYMLGYGALRFVLEFFRETSFTTVFHLAHVWSILCAVIGYSIYATIKQKKKLSAKKK